MFTKPSELLICKLVNKNRNCIAARSTRMRSFSETHGEKKWNNKTEQSICVVRLRMAIYHLLVPFRAHLHAFGCCKWWNWQSYESAGGKFYSLFSLEGVFFIVACIRWQHLHWDSHQSIFVHVFSEVNTLFAQIFRFERKPRETQKANFRVLAGVCLRTSGSVGERTYFQILILVKICISSAASIRFINSVMMLGRCWCNHPMRITLKCISRTALSIRMCVCLHDASAGSEKVHACELECATIKMNN